MNEFWEKAFQNKQEMWGFEPAKSAIFARDFFLEKGVKNVLIPGIGYGRNASPFLESDMHVTGIEISQTAIELAQKHFGDQIKIYQGSVTEMPYDAIFYDGIFCYGLIYLIDHEERKKFIQNCYHQLTDNGYMIFTAITKGAKTYGQGTKISKDRFEMFEGVRIFFYDKETIYEEFKDAGLVEVSEIEENYPFYLITCKK